MLRLLRSLMSVILAVVWFSGSAARTQDEPYAAVLTVVREGVEIQRANTEAWLPLPQGAEAPFGAGDTLRTNEDGRARLALLNYMDIYILPLSTYQLTDATLSSGGLNFASQVESGLAIHKPSLEAIWASVRLNAGALTITQPAALFGVWGDAARGGITTVAEGDLTVEVNGSTVEIGAGFGLYAPVEAAPTLLQLDGNLNAARLIGAIAGCPGIIDTVSGQNLNTRVGPNDQAWIVFSIPGQTPVQIMAANEANTWYRVQVLSGYGWVRRELIATDCVDLPTMPDDTREENIRIIAPEAWELELLEPFFGPPETDRWFYQDLNQPG